jgi:ABC-2 type transport system ATP-binding protein
VRILKFGLVLLLLAALAALPAPAWAKPAHSAENATVESPDGTTIAITVFKPSAAASGQVPVILHSHGWGGSRSTTMGGSIGSLLDAGFGVVSIDQRGHGESGGQAHVQDPTRETEDIKAVIDFVGRLPWALHDRDRRGRIIANDPVLGAIGGSYGGGYQTMTALDEIADEGRTRFNALAPEITWYDLPRSLAPNKVVRTAWATLLYAVGAQNVPNYIHEAFVWGAATGQWPDGTVLGEPVDGVPDIDSKFHQHSPVWFVEQGVRIDVPVLFRQGITDNLFNLNEGLDIFQRALTPKARRHSLFVGYNGGHALPNTLPPGTGGGTLVTPEDTCSGDWTELTISFFEKVFARQSPAKLLPARYNLTTADASRCLHLHALPRATSVAAELPGVGSVVAIGGMGAPVHLGIAEGPITLAGVPALSGTATALGVDARAFLGLSVGTTPADAEVIQNNLTPLRRALPVQDEPFSMDLAGVAVDVPEGQTLYLTVSPVSDLFLGHGSKSPNGWVLGDLEVSLPLVTS